MQEAVKGIGVLAVSGWTLWVTKLDAAHVKEWAQILLLLATFVFTVLQVVSIAMKIAHTRKISRVLKEAQAKCEKAVAGNCPVGALFDTIVAKKE